MKLMIIGHARHGKDTVADLMGLTYLSSSMVALEAFLFDELQTEYDYETLFDAYKDRGNHRAEWCGRIAAYCAEDKARLIRHAYETEASDVYVGVRKRDELAAARREGLFDLAIWVDASGRLPPEDNSAMDVTQDDADLVLNNDGSEAQLAERVTRIAKAIRRCR